MLQRVLTPKKLTEFVNNRFQPHILDPLRPKEFVQSIRTFFPQIQQSLTEIEHLRLPDVRVTDFYLRAAFLHAFLRRLHRNSLLVEFVISADGNSLTCAPYHGAAIHQIDLASSSDLLVARPAVLADKTRALFSSEITEFQHLLNDPSTRERHLQKFLEDHPNFLRGLNYTNVYPQLVLERDHGTQLQPDFILEPYHDMWCDILDIKLPTQALIVGRRDRATLAAAIHEVAAQLREYAAYFEEEKHRTFVQQKYGLRIYKPRLIAVVGRDMRQMTDPQIRRAMTAYDGLQIMTFDQLVEHTKRRLLL